MAAFREVHTPVRALSRWRVSVISVSGHPMQQVAAKGEELSGLSKKSSDATHLDIKASA